jgi:hypothetical protein
MQIHQLAAPPPDIELGFPRQPLKYCVVTPPAGIGPNTGLMLFICPWGMAIEDEYVGTKLLPYLAEQHDCLVAAANYFGIGVKRRAGRLAEFDGWRQELVRRFGPTLADLALGAVFGELTRLGVTSLPGELPLILDTYPEYQSFGLLPAMDHIALIGALLSEYPARHDRIYGFGSSYGGYIACLMLKLMPNSFHAIVENSGFVSALPDEMASLEAPGRYWFDANGLRLACVPASPWTQRDPASRCFVSPSVLAIRSCTEPDHYAPSQTHLTSYHAAGDRLIPIGDKQAFWAALDGEVRLRCVTVEDDMIDGRLFKTNAHGMDASLQLLADDGFKGLPVCAEAATTDFSRGSTIELRAIDRTYRAVYRPDFTVIFSVTE